MFGFSLWRGRGRELSPGMSLIVVCLVVPFIGYTIFGQVRESLAMRSWNETQARILDLELHTSHSSRSSSSHYITARFEYAVPGETAPRVGSRVAVQQEGSIWWDAAQAMFKRLDAQRQAGAAVTCYYDPANPSNAVLSRDLPEFAIGTEVLIALIFFWVGVVKFRGIRASQREIAESVHQANTPYRPGEEWAQERNRRGGPGRSY